MAKKSRRKRERVSARRRIENHSSGFESTTYKVPSGMQLFKIDSSGTKRLDILPYTVGKGNPYADKGSDHYERTFFIHRGIGVNNTSYICPKRTASKKCPICEHRSQLRKEDDTGNEDMIKELVAKERQLWVLYDREDMDAGIQLWEYSHHLFGKMLDDMIRDADDDDDYEFFADLEDGFTLKVGFEEKSFAKTKYYEARSIEFKARKNSYNEELLEKIPCLDDLLIMLPYDELRSIFLQIDSDEDEEDKPKKRKKKVEKEVEAEADHDEDEDDIEDETDNEPDDEEDQDITSDDDVPKCKACKGIGKNSKGRRCRPCDGTGKAPDQEEDEDEIEKPFVKKEEKPKKPKKKAKAPVEDDEDDDDWDSDWDEDDE